MRKWWFILVLAFVIVSCKTVQKPYYFNDGDIVQSDEAGVGVCVAMPVPCVVITKGNFRKIVGIFPESGKSFKVTYE